MATKDDALSKQKPTKTPSLGTGAAERAKKQIQERGKQLDKEIDKYTARGSKKRSA